MERSSESLWPHASSSKIALWQSCWWRLPLRHKGVRLVTGRRLLLADDSITIQKVVNLTFADEGMEVTAVGSGDLAIEKLEEIAPDIVLADVHMPGLNGYEVCEFVKRNEKFRHIPVMLLVGSFEPFDEAEARRVGADDYLTKPFQSIRQLVSKVGAMLGGKSATEELPTRELDTTREINVEPEAQATETVSPATPPTAELAAESVLQDNEVSNAFADPSFDDSLIEATPAHEFNVATSGGASRGTTPLSTSELAQAAVEHSKHAPIHTQDTLRMYVRDDIPENVSATSPMGAQSPHSARAYGSDDALLDLDDAEPQTSPHGEDDFILDIWDDSPQQAVPGSTEVVEEEAVQYVGDVTEVPSPAVQLVDTMAAGSMVVAEPVPVDTIEEEAVPVFPHVEPSPAPQSHSGLITLEQLSPEVIDAIARRAVEQLSEKVVEQIAWEVVPDLAERMIKRKLEEGKT